jgi:hypothetical protein
MGKFFYLPPNAKTVKWNKNSNAKSTNLILESTKSQWQTLPWLVEWLGSPPWAKCTNKMKKNPSRTLKPTGFFHFSLSRFFAINPRVFGDFFSDFFGKNRDFGDFLNRGSNYALAITIFMN